MNPERIHVAAIDGTPVRFYRPLAQAGGPSFPWPDDAGLTAALTRCGLSPQALFAAISEEEQGEIIVTADPAGLVLLVPPRLAFRLVLARSRFNGDDAPVFAFLNASRAALEALTATMPPEEARSYALAVFSRWQ